MVEGCEQSGCKQAGKKKMQREMSEVGAREEWGAPVESSNLSKGHDQSQASSSDCSMAGALSDTEKDARTQEGGGELRAAMGSMSED
jgi:hypothetical protein